MRKGRLTDHIGLKIVSLVIGFLVWLIVVNVDNPKDTKTFTIPGDSVELLNTAYIDSYNKMCIQDDDPEPIRVTVNAERKQLQKLSPSDISVYADLQQAVSLDTDPVMVPLSVTCSKAPTSTIKVSPQLMSVRLEDKVSQDYVVTPSYGDSKPGRGYEVGTQTAYPEKIKITGPRSLMNKIDKVIAPVNVDGETKDTTEEVQLSIVDRNQDVLSDGRMALLTIDNNAKANVTTKFWRIMPDVRFFVAYIGEPADGYQVESVTTVPDTISLAGTDEALEKLRSDDNTLWLMDESLDISGQKSDFEQKISLSGLLPENTRLTTGSSEDVYVNIQILPEDSHSYSIPSNKVRVQGLKDSLQVSFETDAVTFRVKANAGSDIEEFDVSSVKAAVDLSDLGEGTHEIAVDFWLPRGYSLLEDVETGITISEITTVEETPDNGG